MDRFTPLRLVERVSHYVCWIWAAAARSQDVLANIVAPCNNQKKAKICHLRERWRPEKTHEFRWVLLKDLSKIYGKSLANFSLEIRVHQ